MKVCFIVNAGAGKAAESGAVIEEHARGSAILKTSRPGDAARLARQALGERHERIIIAGGDGTLNEVINGLGRDYARIEVAVVPLGTGNDLGRALDLPADDLAAAINLALDGASEPIDVLVLKSAAGQRYVVNASCGGFDIHQSAGGESKRRWGALSYWVTHGMKLLDLPEHDAELVIDDAPLRARLHGLVVANGRFVAGGFPVGGDAWMDDGRMNLTLVPVQPLTETLLAAFNTARGVPDHDRLVLLEARRVQIQCRPRMDFNADGELLGEADPVFEFAEHKLRIVAGPNAALAQTAREPAS